MPGLIQIMLRQRLAIIAAVLAAAAPLCLIGCSGRTVRRAEPTSVPGRDTPDALRGTIGSMASFEGVQRGLVSGIGFVVGLNGTGGQPLSERYATTIERQMALHGIGEPGRYTNTALEGLTPRQLIQNKNTAVVLVYGAMPVGASEGDTFDVFVRAINASSLEGGRLWTTELRRGPPATLDQAQASVVGEAGGEVFVNPYADPGNEDMGVTRLVGRVLDGGRAVEAAKIVLRLDNPSHARARILTSAINSRFPRRSGEREPVAVGRNDERIEVRVPASYSGDRGRFVNLLQHLQIDNTAPQLYARRYAQAMRATPGLADRLGWALEALGDSALPFIRDLYDVNDAAPRLAALRAGAGLGDPRATGPLIEMATEASDALRVDAIRALSRLPGGPRIDEALRPMLGDDTLTIRVAAYEALATRAQAASASRLVSTSVRRAPGSLGANSRNRLAGIAAQRLTAGARYGVAREPIAGKFLLDRVPFGEPMIYVTQQGTPRIVLFGESLTLTKPVLASVWSDRLMISADGPDSIHRLYYRDVPPGGDSTLEDLRVPVVQRDVPDELPALIELMARDPSEYDPDPGLGFSYSEVVGALQALQSEGAIEAAFATERDRLVADLLAAGESLEVEMRPVAPGDRAEVIDIGRELRPEPRNPSGEGDGGLLEPVVPPGGGEGSSDGG